MHTVLLFKTAFQSLITENYTNFILRIGFSAVAIYCHSNNTFKVFDSHARDLYVVEAIHTVPVYFLNYLSYLVHYFH